MLAMKKEKRHRVQLSRPTANEICILTARRGSRGGFGGNARTEQSATAISFPNRPFVIIDIYRVISVPRGCCTK